MVPELTCQHCGVIAEPDLAYQPTTAGSHHLGAYCTGCGRWMKWVPQRAPWVHKGNTAQPLPEDI